MAAQNKRPGWGAMLLPPTRGSLATAAVLPHSAGDQGSVAGEGGIGASSGASGLAFGPESFISREADIRAEIAEAAVARMSGPSVLFVAGVYADVVCLKVGVEAEAAGGGAHVSG